MSTKVLSSHYSFISLSPGDLSSWQLLCDSPPFIVNTLICSSWFNLLKMSCNRQLMMDVIRKGKDKHASSCERFRALRAGVCTKQSLCDMVCNQIWRQSVYGCSRLPHLESELERKVYIPTSTIRPTRVCIQMYVYVIGNSNHMNRMTNMLYNKRTNEKTSAFTRTTVSNTKWVK